LAAVHLIDSHYITDASKYISVLLLSLRAMLQLELPHVNVLSKIDLIAAYSELREFLRPQRTLRYLLTDGTNKKKTAFNLEFYTQVQDLSYLEAELEKDPREKRYAALNRAICELIDDFGLVSFETLCVEDKKSMMRLVRAVDRALGYVPPSVAAAADEEGLEGSAVLSDLWRETDPFEEHLALQEVQEKFVDYKEEYREWEKEQWKKEGDEAIERANEKSRKEAIEKEKKAMQSG
jgi:hypothetical protein